MTFASWLLNQWQTASHTTSYFYRHSSKAASNPPLLKNVILIGSLKSIKHWHAPVKQKIWEKFDNRKAIALPHLKWFTGVIHIKKLISIFCFHFIWKDTDGLNTYDQPYVSPIKNLFTDLSYSSELSNWHPLQDCTSDIYNPPLWIIKYFKSN